jgi:hypothetical protein
LNTPAWVWVPPFAYAAHIADEFFAGDGFYNWVGEFAEFSARSFLGVNFMIISLIAAACTLSRRDSSAGFLGVAVFTQFGLHGVLVHPAFSLWRGEPGPGLVTGLAILLPATLVGFRWSVRSLSRRAIGAGVVAGCVLFASQDLWRVLFNRLIGPGA